MARKKKKEYKYILDGYGNICEIAFFGTEAKAKKALHSLINCHQCRNCFKCENCFKCTECVNIKNTANVRRKINKSNCRIPKAYL